MGKKNHGSVYEDDTNFGKMIIKGIYSSFTTSIYNYIDSYI